MYTLIIDSGGSTYPFEGSNSGHGMNRAHALQTRPVLNLTSIQDVLNRTEGPPESVHIAGAGRSMQMDCSTLVHLLARAVSNSTHIEYKRVDYIRDDLMQDDQ